MQACLCLFRRLAASALFAASLAAAPSATASPVLGAEQELAPVTYNHFAGWNTALSIATNGTDFLVVWSHSGAIEGARVTAAQVLLDRPCIPLALTGPSPQAFWDGQKYLVVSGGSAQRMDPATGALAPAFTLHGAPATGRAAFEGGEIFDVWQDASGALQGGVFDLAGALVQGNVALPSGGVTDWGVASSAGPFLVAWITKGKAVGAARVSAAGVIADPTGIVIAGAQGGSDGGTPSAATSINVAGSPGGYLVSWVAGESPYAYDRGARIGLSGIVADPGGIPLFPSLSLTAKKPLAAWANSEWWVVEQGWGAVLGTTGSPSAPGSYAVGTDALAANPGARLVVDSRYVYTVYGAGVSPSGAGSATQSFAVSTYPTPHELLCTVASAAGYLVLFGEPLNSGYGPIEGIRFRTDGTPIDATAFSLGSSSYEGPMAACGVIGSSYYFASTVPYLNGTVGDIGMLPTDGPLAITSNIVPLGSDAGPGPVDMFEPLSMACLSDRCLVTWWEPQLATMAMIFGASGAVIAPPFLLAHPNTRVPAALAAADGNGFLIAWSSTILPVAADGTHGSPLSEGDPNVAALASGGGTFLLTGNSTAYPMDGTGLLHGSPEPLPIPAASLAWEKGRFLAAGPSAQGVAGMELTAGPGGGAVATFPLFKAGGRAVVASNGVGDAVFSAQPRGVFATARLVGRFGVPGPDPVPLSDAGTPDADAGGGNTDAGNTDAGGGDTDAGGDDGGAEADATADGEAVGDATTDATTSDDAAAGPGGRGPGGCGCSTAGSGPGSPGAGFSLAALAFLLGRRRVRRGQGRAA